MGHAHGATSELPRQISKHLVDFAIHVLLGELNALLLRVLDLIGRKQIILAESVTAVRAVHVLSK
jgi:hypothetical protein